MPKRLALLIFVASCALSSLAAFGQPPETDATRLVVGTISMPPFAMKDASGDWKGLSIDLLDMISIELGREYEVREFTEIKELQRAVSTGEIDIIPAMAATEEAEKVLDLTQPYYRSGYAIAVSAKDTGRGWTSFFRSQELKQIFSVIAALVLLWLLAGLAIWLVERHRNKAMFGGDPISGLGHGIWWAAVTMSTVGYGDKAPVTPAGRVIAIVWMFASIVVVSSFTASISASLTVQKLATKVHGLQDLPNVSAGTLVDSNLVAWLRQRGITASTFPSIEEGLRAIVDDKIDAFVFDEAVLKSVTARAFPGSIYVLPRSFEHYYVSMGVTNNSPLRESINRAMLKVMVTDDWNKLLLLHLAVKQ